METGLSGSEKLSGSDHFQSLWQICHIQIITSIYNYKISSRIRINFNGVLLSGGATGSITSVTSVPVTETVSVQTAPGVS